MQIMPLALLGHLLAGDDVCKSKRLSPRATPSWAMRLRCRGYLGCPLNLRRWSPHDGVPDRDSALLFLMSNADRLGWITW